MVPELEKHMESMSLYKSIPFSEKIAGLSGNKLLADAIENAIKKTSKGAKKASSTAAYGAYGEHTRRNK